MAAIVGDCEPVGSAVTDEDGVAFIDAPPGRYVVIGGIDWDGDGVFDDYVGSPVGHIRCGQWKTTRVTLQGDTDDSEHP